MQDSTKAIRVADMDVTGVHSGTTEGPALPVDSCSLQDTDKHRFQYRSIPLTA